MKQSLLISLLILPLIGLSQAIVVNKYDLTVHSSLDKNDREYSDSLFNSSDFEIFLVKLLPDCDENNNCYAESIIIDDYNWKTPVSDSTFGQFYFQKVNYQLIDSASIIPVDSNDYRFFLSELLEGPRKRDKNEIIDVCYNPRHAVLFKDEQDKIIAVHEICFECGHTKVAMFTSEIRHNSSFPFLKLFRKYQLME